MFELHCEDTSSHNFLCDVKRRGLLAWFVTSQIIWRSILGQYLANYLTVKLLKWTIFVYLNDLFIDWVIFLLLINQCDDHYSSFWRIRVRLTLGNILFALLHVWRGSWTIYPQDIFWSQRQIFHLASKQMNCCDFNDPTSLHGAPQPNKLYIYGPISSKHFTLLMYLVQSNEHWRLPWLRGEL